MKLDEFKKEIIEHHIDEYLQVTVDRDPTRWSTGNGVLHTALFYSILSINNAIDAEDIARFSRAIDICWVGENNKYLGLLEKDDERPDKEAQDDYHVATASKLLKTYHAEAIWNWGITHSWSFNNESPNKWGFSTWHRRFPGHVPYLYAAAGKDLDCLQSLELKLCLSLSSMDRSDSFMQTWLKIQAVKNIPVFKASVDRWECRAKNKYPNIGQAFEPYFGSNHPMSHVPKLGVWG